MFLLLLVFSCIVVCLGDFGLALLMFGLLIVVLLIVCYDWVGVLFVCVEDDVVCCYVWFWCCYVLLFCCYDFVYACWFTWGFLFVYVWFGIRCLFLLRLGLCWFSVCCCLLSACLELLRFMIARLLGLLILFYLV